jgi:hypothetical protein
LQKWENMKGQRFMLRRGKQEWEGLVNNNENTSRGLCGAAAAGRNARARLQPDLGAALLALADRC